MLYHYLVLLLLFLMSVPLRSEPIPELTEFTDTQIAALSQAVAARDSEEVETELRGWSFKRFFLRLTAKVGFDLKAAKIELLPELELVWQKDAT